MKRRQFLAALAAAPRRPNILLVLLDDFGIGHCSSYSQFLQADTLDPAYQAFLHRRPRKRPGHLHRTPHR